MEFSFICKVCNKKKKFSEDALRCEYRKPGIHDEKYWIGCCSYASIYFDENKEIIYYSISPRDNNIWELNGYKKEQRTQLVYANDLFSKKTIQVKKFIALDISISFEKAFDKLIKKMERFENFK